MTRPDVERRITCPAELKHLPALLQLVDTACGQLNATPAEQHDLRLMAEEACVNVMRHAYPVDAPGSMTFCFTATGCAPGHLVAMTIEDAGTPFDPLSRAPPDLAAPAEERGIGGLGILLIRQLADHVAYRHDAARGNIFVIEKALGQLPTAPAAQAH